MRPFLLSVLVLVTAIPLPSSARAKEAATACTVTVRTKMKSGDLKKRIFHSRAATAEACAEDARLHNENYFPPKISSVKVEYEFSGGGKVSLPEAR